jgi:hypothetical protein
MTEANVYEGEVDVPFLQAVSFYPIGNVCTPGGVSFENIVSPFTGANIKKPMLKRLNPPPTVDIGPKRNNPDNLSGVDDINLWPSSRKLDDIGIATQPLNLRTRNSNVSSPWADIGITYLSPNTSTAKSDYRRYTRAVAIRRTGTTPKDCGGDFITVISGSQGITSDGIGGCSDAKLRGRISWREILKD